MTPVKDVRNRVERRHPKRIPLKFGFDQPEKVGFTNDLNHEGLFIRSPIVVKPGAKIKVEISHPEGLITLIGVVRWAKKVPGNVIHKMKGGMGLKIISFLSGEDLYRTLCNELDEQRRD